MLQIRCAICRVPKPMRQFPPPWPMILTRNNRPKVCTVCAGCTEAEQQAIRAANDPRLDGQRDLQRLMDAADTCRCQTCPTHGGRTYGAVMANVTRAWPTHSVPAVACSECDRPMLPAPRWERNLLGEDIVRGHIWVCLACEALDAEEVAEAVDKTQRDARLQ